MKIIAIAGVCIGLLGGGYWLGSALEERNTAAVQKIHDDYVIYAERRYSKALEDHKIERARLEKVISDTEETFTEKRREDEREKQNLKTAAAGLDSTIVRLRNDLSARHAADGDPNDASACTRRNVAMAGLDGLRECQSRYNAMGAELASCGTELQRLRTLWPR